MGLGFGTSKQSSQSYSGVRGTPQFADYAANYSNLANQAFSTASKYAKSPFGFFQGQSVNQLAPVSQYGLPPELSNAMGSIASQYFSKASAGGSLQGMNSPENTAGIVGSSLNNIGQFLTPHVLDYAKYRQQLPEELMKNRLGFLQGTLGATTGGLGNESSASGSAFNFDSGVSASFGGYKAM